MERAFQLAERQRVPPALARTEFDSIVHVLSAQIMPIVHRMMVALPWTEQAKHIGPTPPGNGAIDPEEACSGHCPENGRYAGRSGPFQ